MVRITVDSGVDSIDHTPKAAVDEDLKAGGYLIVEIDIAELVEITEDDNSKKYQTDCLHHLAE